MRQKIKTETEDKIYIRHSANEIKKPMSVHKTTITGRPQDANYHKWLFCLLLNLSNSYQLAVLLPYKTWYILLSLESILLMKTNL